MVLNILLILPLLIAPVISCPPEEDIAPHCFCKDMGHGPMLSCDGLMSAEELIPPIKNTDKLPMFSIMVTDSSLLYVPSGLFKNTRFHKIMFWNTRLMSLSDSDLAFEGLEDSLEELRVVEAQYVTQWDWSQLRKHRRLELIDINSISLYSLDEQFPPLKSLRSLGISKAELSYLHPTAFKELSNLQLLVLKKNDLRDLRRSMFPEHASHLFHIDLSDNQIVSLPKNIFDVMPSLLELHLENNQFVSLDENTFSWPLEHLQTLKLTGNNIQCDCRLRWLVNTKLPHYFEGFCDQPPNMKGAFLKYLTNKDLWC